MAAILQMTPDSKVHGANMGPIWGRQDPGGPHVGPMNFATWDTFKYISLNEDVWISLKIPLKVVPKVQINSIPALVQIMAWCQPDHYLNQWWLNYWRIYQSLHLNELTH